MSSLKKWSTKKLAKEMKLSDTLAALLRLGMSPGIFLLLKPKPAQP